MATAPHTAATAASTRASPNGKAPPASTGEGLNQYHGETRANGEAFNLANPATNERIANRTVFKRPGEPQDVANAIAFLCSDLAAYITGVELNVSGGVELFVF